MRNLTNIQMCHQPGLGRKRKCQWFNAFHIGARECTHAYEAHTLYGLVKILQPKDIQIDERNLSLGTL